MSKRNMNAAFAIAAALLAVVGELVIADTDHYEAPLWGSTVTGLWAAIGLLSTAVLVFLVMALTRISVTPNEDPPEQEEGIDG